MDVDAVSRANEKCHRVHEMVAPSAVKHIFIETAMIWQRQRQAVVWQRETEQVMVQESWQWKE